MLRRKPSDWFHVLLWNTETDEVTSGDWYNQMLHVEWSDVSADGHYFVTYVGYGATVLSRPPSLKPVIYWPGLGGWEGGGFFPTSDRLELDADRNDVRTVMGWLKSPLPFDVHARSDGTWPRRSAQIFAQRMVRDGWRNENGYWIRQDTPDGPLIRFETVGSRKYRFDSPTHPALFDSKVNFATFDCKGDLVMAREGVLRRYTREGMATGQPSAVIDLETLTHPAKASHVFRHDPTQPEVQVVVGKMEQHRVNSFVLSQNIELPWVGSASAVASNEEEVRRLIAKDLSVFTTRWQVAGSSYQIYLRVPPPNLGFEALLEACTAAFEEAGKKGGTIALRPIGMGEGWTTNDAVLATFLAGQAYARSNWQTVKLMADNLVEAIAFRSIIHLRTASK